MQFFTAVIYCIQFIVSRVSTGAQEKEKALFLQCRMNGELSSGRKAGMLAVPVLHPAAAWRPLSMQLCMKEVFL